MAAASAGNAPQANEDHPTRNRQQSASSIRAFGSGMCLQFFSAQFYAIFLTSCYFLELEAATA
jgi:hypothetical protein